MSPSPAVGPPPSPCSIWAPVDEELEALSLGWEDAALKEKFQRTRACTPPAFSGLTFPSLASPNPLFQSFSKTEPRPMKLRPEREVSRRRLFPEASKQFQAETNEAAAEEQTSCPGMSDAPVCPLEMAPTEAGPAGTPQGGFSPLALPPNTVLVPTDDPNNPGQSLFRLMTVDPSTYPYMGMPQRSMPMFPQEVYTDQFQPNMSGVLPYVGVNSAPFHAAPVQPRAYAQPNPVLMPAWPPMNQKIHCLVEFKRGRTMQYEAPAYVAPGEYVIVGGDRGEDLGMVVHTWTSPSVGGDDSHASGAISPGGNSPNSSVSSGSQYDSFGNPVTPVDQTAAHIIRRATAKEVQYLHNIQSELEKRCVEVCQQKVLEHGLVLTVVDAEYQFDRKKLTFYYDAAERQDFRGLVCDLYKTYRARIWMSKINTGHR
eukprot:GGOE01008739.1.p1 GENE.GGOE01008739.1~~GGOE01008739.1.p1  ORF type:complete len:440 (-),score=68.42 GGOE01008739.1:1585-2865(-)